MASIHTVVLSTENESVDIENGSLFFIGTATVLLRYAGFTILTDPNFLHQGDHIHAGYGLQAVRQTNPALELDQLPSLDFVLLSHLHEDHFDRLVVKKLDKGVPIVTTSSAAKALHKKGFRLTYGLDTWQAITMVKGEQQLHITAMPGTHGPGPLGKLLPPVMGSMLEFETTRDKTTMRLYITGDTLIFKQLKEIPKRYPDIDLALLHLGGTKFFGVMLTMDAKQGVEAMRLINPHEAIPIHYNDYNVFKSPLEDFKSAVAKAGLEKRVHYLSHGETYEFKVPAGRR
ncbi:MAG: MBL fold metallo-hydrolase [Chloroflexota bacterium]|nr:MBL fold metallo-hydrolase [Chloroflexota bacterium]